MKELVEYGDGLLWYCEEDGVYSIGVTQRALDQAGSISSIEFSEVGDEFTEGDWIAELHGANARVEVLAPCNLKVEELNGEAAAETSLVEDDPTGDAWLLRASPQ